MSLPCLIILSHKRTRKGSRFISSELGVKLGEVYYVASVEEISKRGDSGIARINGLIIFVPNTNPGTKIRLITKLGTGYAKGEVMEQTIENHRKNEVEQEEGVKTEPGPIAMNDDLERERVDVCVISLNLRS